jgi:hypothetical protein
MSSEPDPPFADVFGDLSPDAISKPPPLDAGELAQMLATAGRPAGAHLDTGPSTPRFDGDTSELPAELCWTLQELVVAPHIGEGSRSWALLLQHEDVLRSRLSELGLVLEVSREHGYAFTQQADDPSPRARVLLRARTLSLSASALALYLYNQYLLAPEESVETSDMVDHMLGYKPTGDSDEAGFVKKIHAAIRSLDDAHVIQQVPGTTRYLVYPVIMSLLTADRVEALTAAYQSIADGTGTAADTAVEQTPDGPEKEADDE